MEILDVHERRGGDVREHRRERHPAAQHVPQATGSDRMRPYDANDASTAALLRRSFGRVSGTRRYAVAAHTAPNTASTTNTPRQPEKRRICPPISGASSGPTAVTIATIDSTFAASVGSCASRAIARDSTDAAPARAPAGSARDRSMSIDVDTKQPMLASVNSAMPPSSTGRRPHVSDSGRVQQQHADREAGHEARQRALRGAGADGEAGGDRRQARQVRCR